MSDVTLWQGDCLELMRDIPSGSVDAIVTDPPYGVDLDYSGYDDSFANWISLIERFIPEAIRVSRGPVIIPTSKFEAEQYLHKLNPIWRLCWFKGASCTRSPVGFKDWEPTFIFGKRPRKQIHDYFTAHANQVREDVSNHPCPKPLKWALWLVSKMSDQGDTILDPFMGSGTTGIACIKTGRKFIGIEIDPIYFQVAERRLASAATPMFSAIVRPAEPLLLFD